MNGSPPHALGAVATGFASRSLYFWGGAGYENGLGAGDRPGDLLFYSLLVGYRPPFFQVNLPWPDARIFVEAIGEQIRQSQAGGGLTSNSGGHQVMVGPTTLILWDKYGLSGGVLFPVYQQLYGSQPRERYRAAINGTYFF
jgi:hypothetical protein